MTDRIIFQDLTVLAICPSEKWSTLQRRAIFDCTYIRNIGGNPVILCLEGGQVAKEAEKEDIQTIYLKKYKFTGFKDFKFILEFRNLLKEERFDIIHCYDLDIMWISSFLMKSNQGIPLFFTFNQNIKNVYNNIFTKWLLRRVDNIFTLSEEIQDFVRESFLISPSKVKNIGSGLDVLKIEKDKKTPNSLGCLVDNIHELNRLKSIMKIFRFLKTYEEKKFQELKLSIFLGPLVYQSDEAKKLLTEMEHEFYEGDVFLYELNEKVAELKKIDIFIGMAFDEPINDYEVISLIHDIPVLFPRTAMRQSLVYKYENVGETYFEEDIREGRSKLVKMINNYPKYLKSLTKCAADIYEVHGVEPYGDLLESSYAQNVAKRSRFVKFQETK